MTPEELRQLQEMERLADLEAAENAPVEQKARILQEGAPEQPSIVSEVENTQINNQAKSPYQKTQAELIQDKISSIRDKSGSDIKTARDEDRRRALLANAVKALGSIGAADIQRKVGVDVGLKDFQPVKVQDTAKEIKSDRDVLIKQLQDQYKALQGEKITPYQQAQLDESKAKRESSEKMAAQKLVGGIKEESKAELARQKDERKQTETLQKENRKVRQAAQDSLTDIDKQIANVEKAATKLKNLSKTGIADTGPIDQYLSPMGNKGQELRQIFNEISLDKMTKMFAGMSKAIDSDAERKFFEQSQVSMGNYPAVNMEILNNMVANLKSLKAKNQGTLKSIDKKGREVAPEQQVSDFVTMVAPNGQTKNVRKEQVQKYLDKGATIKE